MSNAVLVVGLGSNINPHEHLKRALKYIRNLPNVKLLDVSRIYESDPVLPAQLIDYTADSWNHQFLNAAVRLNVSKFQPLEFLRQLKQIEKSIGRDSEAPRWSPREIDLDILFIEGQKVDLPELKVPHLHLFERPFALLPLFELVNEAQFINNLHTLAVPAQLPNWATQSWNMKKPFNTEVSSKFFWTEFLGILNLTDDSFSDGHANSTLEKFKMNVVRLLESGAQVLDIGAESTRPRRDAEAARPHQIEFELEKLSSALESLIEFKKNYPQMKISVDCRHPQVLDVLLNRFKIDFINDVTGFRAPQMIELAKKSDCKIIVMHSLSVPVVQNEIIDPNLNPIDILNAWWKIKWTELTQSGIDAARIIFDPGIGFGKSPGQNVYILQNLMDIESLGCDILIGHSRKSFLQTVTNKPAQDRDPETALVTRSMNKAGYQYLRLHDVSVNKSALEYI